MSRASVKKVLFIGLLFILYILWQAIGTLSEYYTIANYPPPHKGPTVLFGDSLPTQSPDGFPAILDERLNIHIDNRSVASSTIHSAGEAVRQEIGVLRPRVVIFCFSNILEQEQFQNTAYLSELREMIASAQHEGAVTVLLGADRDSKDTEYTHAMQKLARETHSLVVVNILATISDQKYWEGAFPNKDGNLRIADLIAPTLEGLIIENSESVPSAE